jgi:hypothetical protein
MPPRKSTAKPLKKAATRQKPSVMKYPYHSTEGWKWYIETFHPTGVPMDPSASQKFRSKAEAQEYLKYNH